MLHVIFRFLSLFPFLSNKAMKSLENIKRDSPSRFATVKKVVYIFVQKGQAIVYSVLIFFFLQFLFLINVYIQRT